ncbi:MAG: protein-tyrosine-phosphatase [Bacteroidetes bacterium]|nr:protein-tyrosine-phosphatase [Bacteroidota bacterium]
MKSNVLFKNLEDYCSGLEQEFELIPKERLKTLKSMVIYIANKAKEGKSAKLTVICTHNSRRSHFGQIWLEVAATYYGLEAATFSGGTEATAVHPNIIAVLRSSGLDLIKVSEGSNPVYEMRIGPGVKAHQIFSKKYDHEVNPSSNFAVITVCSEADKGCPVVIGAEARFHLPYSDPKVSDGTVYEMKTYEERCREVAREMLLVMYFTQLELNNGMPTT